MNLGKGEDIVAMAILPAGVAPEGSSDDEDEEEEAAAGAAAGAAASSSSGSPTEEEEAAAGGEGGAQAGPSLLLISQQGLGKRTPVSAFPRKMSRRGKGMKALGLKPGDRLAAMQVVGAELAAPAGGGGAATESCSDDEAGARRSGGGGKAADVLLSTQQGQLVRVPVSDISLYGRTAKGRRVVRLREGDEVVAATLLTKQQ